MVKIYNGVLVIFFEGKVIKDAVAFEGYSYNMPMAALSCDLADGCSDYE